jgi:hypothetical protein
MWTTSIGCDVSQNSCQTVPQGTTNLYTRTTPPTKGVCAPTTPTSIVLATPQILVSFQQLLPLASLFSSLPIAFTQPLAALRAANMRLILFQAIVLALACCAAAQRQKNVQIPPHAGINQFPAGPIVPNFPYAVPFYQAPPVPANSYRGTYVSGVPLWTRAVRSLLVQHQS